MSENLTMTRQTISDAAAKLRSGRLRSVELVEASLDAIAQHNRTTNAFIRVDADDARAQAAARDRELAQGHDRGPLHGIPISLKDLVDEAGRVTTAPSRVLAGRVAPADATIVTRLREAGAISVGKTNLHEFALGTTSEDSAFGAVRNPLDLDRSAGGSSGGAAVAVVTGMGLAAIGSDTGGSIRIPSACCGTVGLKPSFGEVPIDGVIQLSASLDHVGPLARSVRDAALMWAALIGRAAPVLADTAPGGIRLRRLVGYFESPLGPDVRAAFDGALGRLQAAGATVERVELPEASRIPEMYVNTVLPEAAYYHRGWLDPHKNEYLPAIRSRLEAGRSIPAVAYLDARAAAAALRRAIDRLLDGCDALVLPTLPIVAPPIGAGDVVIDPAIPTGTPVRSAMLRQTQPFNLSGHPAISLPIASSGLPVGLQLVGELNQTARLLDLAAACEKIVT